MTLRRIESRRAASHPARLATRFAILVCSVFLLGACGGGGGGNDGAPAIVGPQTITVSGSLGRTRGAGVQALDADGATLSDEEETGVAGTAILSIPGDHTGPVTIRVRGRAGATYFDEATGTFLDFPAGRQIRAMLPAPRPEAGVSILTELAVQLIEASGQAISADLINEANETIRAALAPEVSDLLSPPLLVDDTTGPGDVRDNDAGRLAARLAALAELGDGAASPALRVLAQLADDVTDGVIDGNGAAGAINNLAYTPATFVTDFSDAVRAFAAQFGNASLQSTAQDATADTSTPRPGTDAGGDGGDGGDGSDGGDGGDGGDGSDPADPDGDGINGQTSAATVNAAVVATYDLIYTDESPDSSRDPFTDQQQVQVQVTAEGQLIIDGNLTLTDPVNRSLDGTNPHLPEIIWLDPATSLEYALSDNESGTFNEINVGDALAPGQSGIPAFLGQLREEEPGAAEALAPFAATYQVRITSDCDANPDCPIAEPAGATVAVTIGTDGTVQFGDLLADPAATDAQFFDNLNVGSIEPGFNLIVPEGTEGGTLTLQIRVIQGEVVGFGATRSIPQQSGGSRSVAMETEVPELASITDDFFTDFIASTTPPRELTIVVDNTTFTGKAAVAAGVPFTASTALCRTFDISGERNPTNNADRAPLFRYLTQGGSLEFERHERRVARTRDNGDGSTTVSFNGGQFTLGADGSVLYEEGFISGSTGFVGTVVLSASQDATAIEAACADFSTISGTVTTTGEEFVFVRVTVNDSDSGAELFRGDISLDAGVTTDTFSVTLPNDLNYEVTINNQTCTLTGQDTGTLTADVVVDVDCRPQA